MKKGDATGAYIDLTREKPLPIALKAPSSLVPTESQRQRRLAAASRWHKVRLAKAFAAGEEAPVVTPTLLQQLAAPQVRHARRGEFDLLTGSYRQYTDAELLVLVYKVRDKELKTTELAKLYRDGAPPPLPGLPAPPNPSLPEHAPFHQVPSVCPTKQWRKFSTQSHSAAKKSRNLSQAGCYAWARHDRC